MRYISICSGIEAATVAWHPIGWEPAAFAEIDKFPSAVLKHHYPHVKNVGDFTKIQGGEYGTVDLLVGGTPCIDFSIAGLRAGLGGKSGQLTIEFAKLAHRMAANARTRWLVWENVTGVFSSDEGRSFGLFLSILAKRSVPVPVGGWSNFGIIPGAEDGFGLAYRVLDAQYFGVPQRRRRVFVVGYFGDWRRAAAVLLERHSLSGYPPPRRETREDVAPTLSARTKGGGGLGTDFDCDGGLIANVQCAAHRDSVEVFDDPAQWPAKIAPTLNAHFGEKMGLKDQHIREGQVFSSTGETSHCLNAGGMGRQDFETETLIAVGGFFKKIPQRLSTDGVDVADTFTANWHKSNGATTGNSGGLLNAVLHGWRVRRITPVEAERLQGFPDGYTRIDSRTADGPRYTALGNSMAVPCMAWLGKRISLLESI